MIRGVERVSEQRLLNAQDLCPKKKGNRNKRNLKNERVEGRYIILSKMGTQEVTA